MFCSYAVNFGRELRKHYSLFLVVSAEQYILAFALKKFVWFSTRNEGACRSVVILQEKRTISLSWKRGLLKKCGSDHFKYYESRTIGAAAMKRVHKLFASIVSILQDPNWCSF